MQTFPQGFFMNSVKCSPLLKCHWGPNKVKQKTMYDPTGIYKNIQDPQELYNSLQYHTGSDKTLWTIHNQRWLSRSCTTIRNQRKQYHNTNLAAPGALTHRLQHHTACNTTPPATPYRPLYPKWPTGSRNRSNLRLLDHLINFCKLSFLIRWFLLWEPQKSKMAARGTQNGRRRLKRGPPLGFQSLPSTFSK